MKPDPTITEHDAEAQLFGVDAALDPTTTADVLAQYQFIITRATPHSFDAILAAKHAAALAADNEALRAMLSSTTAIEDAAAAGMITAQPVDRVPFSVVQERAAAMAVARYKRAIAEQLAAAPGHKLAGAARKYLADLHAKELAEAEQRAKAEQIAAEKIRIEAERLEKERAEAAARGAEEAAREESAMLSRLSAVHDHEREIVRRRVELKRRLKHTQAPTVRIARGLYGTRDLQFACEYMSEGEIRDFMAGLDRAEAELVRPASPINMVDPRSAS